MAYEIQGQSWHPVDKQTFEDEKRLRLLLPDIAKLGNYILRQMMVPGSGHFAFDCSVKVAKIEAAKERYRLSLGVMDRHGEIVQKLRQIFNSDGFIILDNNAPNRYKDLPPGPLEMGYLIHSVSADPFDRALTEAIRSAETQEITPAIPSLAGVS